MNKARRFRRPGTAVPRWALIPIVGAAIVAQLVVLAPSTRAQGCANPPSGMLTWWPAEGDASDIHGVFHGALQNGATFDAGKIGQAFALDGVDDHVTIPDDPGLHPTSLTLEGWYYFESTGLQVLIGKTAGSGVSNSWAVWFSAGTLSAGVGHPGGFGAVLSTGFAPTLNTWYHIAYTFDSATFVQRLYINGVPRAAGTTTTVPGYDSNPIILGGEIEAGVPSFFFKGRIDEVSIFDRALSGSEVSDIASASQSKCDPGAGDVCVESAANLLGWWPGDGTAEDIEGDNDGVLKNGAMFDTGKVAQAFSFDGTDDYVEIPDAAALRPASVTLEGWFRLSPAVTQVLFGKTLGSGSNNSVALWYQSDGTLRGGVGDAGGFGSQVIAGFVPDANTWYHLAYTFDDPSNVQSLYINGTLFASTVTAKSIGYDGHPWLLGADINSEIVGGFISGAIDEASMFDGALSAAEIHGIFAAGTAGKCKEPAVADVSGSVVADCPASGTGLVGVTVDLEDAQGGFHTTITDGAGTFGFADVPVGEAVISIVIPLGYAAVSPVDGQAVISVGDQAAFDFSLSCVEPTGVPRSMGYWKHQANVYLKGKGQAHESQVDMETDYPDALFTHFHENLLNAIAVEGVTFLPGPTSIDLATIQSTLTINKNGTMLDRAKQQYLAFLLNVASGKLLTSTVVSDDGATASQALQHVACIINGEAGCPEGYEVAKDICDTINNAQLVAAGVIDLSFQNIAYKTEEGRAPAAFSLARNVPNPFNPATTIRMTVPEGSTYSLSIYNVSGRLVRRFVGPAMGREIAVRWDGTDNAGNPVGSGLYFYTLRAGALAETRKMMLLK